MLAANTILQNRYRVVRELGHGGMGTVYEALDQRVNCIVALKETLATRDAEARKAFEREAALLANLRHQALPKVMDYFSENEGDFLVMEFIPGYDLAELLELRGNPFPQSQVLRWADELLKVLEYLHGQRPPILHRDIKPSNLKLTKEGEIFLLDFGLAKGSVGQMPTLASSQSVRGYTPVYASLEQIHGHGTDARSEIYSLGATLYHLLTGAPPLDAPARYHAIEDGQTDPLPAIEALNPSVSLSVAGVIYQSMAVSRKHRPLSATEMRKLLRSASEEDERGAAEEEYRRAEVRSNEIEAGRQSAERVASTNENEIPESGAAEISKARRSGEDDSRQKGANLPTTIAPTLPPTQQAQPSSNQLVESAPALATITSRPPQRLSTDRDSAASSGDALRTNAAGSRRVYVIAAGVLVLILVGAFFIWSRRETAPRDSSVTKSDATASNPVEPPAPVSAAPAGMVYVSGGTFLMGRDNGDDAERPPHQAPVKPFYIDIYEVTNDDYEKFVKATNHRPPPAWKNGSFPAGAGRKPVTGVTWDDANDFARWAGKRLPTEEEWEFSARGTDGRLYPWSNDWQQGSANANGAEQTVADVGAYKGRAPFGTYDMVGNAWEWTASNFRAYPGRGLPASQLAGELKVIRGGCYESTKDYATTTYRAGWPARGAPTYEQTGFRCAKDLGP